MGLRPLRMKVRWGCPPRCCRHRRIGPRADGHACLGSREYRAGGQQTAQSRTLTAGWLVSRSVARLSTAWGADEVVDGPFHGQKPLVRLLRPYYPWWRAFPRWRERSRSSLWQSSLPGSAGSTSSLHLGRICPRIQSYVVLPQAWVSPYQSPHVTSLRAGCGLRSALLWKARFPAVTAKLEQQIGKTWSRLSLKVKIPSDFCEQQKQRKGTAAWLYPAAIYSVVPARTNISKFALGRWEGCNLLHGICLSRAR